MVSSSAARESPGVTGSAQQRPTIAVCMKWVSRAGESADDARFAGISESDQAALEIGFRLAERLDGDVTAIVVGPAGADIALRDAMACGARRAVRVEAPSSISSEDVAHQLSRHVAAATIVVCGDVSADRGSGAVPAFLAHRLGRAQALGLVAVSLTGTGTDAGLDALRRLDGGRRERLRVPMPCVVSVEGSVASLRRAGLRAALAATVSITEQTPVVTPFRPRARVLAAPHGADVLARLRTLTDASVDAVRGENVTLDPAAAAARIVEALREWGYLAP